MRRTYLAALAALLIAALGAVVPALAVPGDTETLPNTAPTRTDGQIAPPAPLDQDGSTAAWSTEEGVGGTAEVRDRTAHQEVYVWERAEPRKAERLTTGVAGAEPDGPSGGPELSADGQVVAFRTNASNLPGIPADRRDDGGETDYLVVDRRTGTRTFEDGSETGIGIRLSDDGDQLAFLTDRRLLPEDDDDGEADVYVRDLSDRSLRVVSHLAGGRRGAWDLAGNGQLVAFGTQDALDPADQDNGDSDLYLVDRDGRNPVLLSGALDPDLSDGDVALDHDASTIVYEHEADDGRREVVVLRRTGNDVRVLRRVTGRVPALSRDGSRLVFQGERTLLGCATTGERSDVYAMAIATGRIERVSARRDGTPDPDNDSFDPEVSGDGRHASFVTEIPNLSANDRDSYRDVAVTELGRFERDVLHVRDQSVEEGSYADESRRDRRFRIELCGPASRDVPLDVHTQMGTADATDYDDVQRRVTIPQGQTGVDVVVKVKGDTAPEPEDTFTLRARPVPGEEDTVTVRRGEATVTLSDDDGWLRSTQVVHSRKVSGNGVNGLYSRRLDGSGATLLATDGVLGELNRPTARRLAFVTTAGDLAVRDMTTGARRTVLTGAQRGQGITDVTWLTENSVVVSRQTAEDRSQLLLVGPMDVTTPNVRELTPAGSQDSHPVALRGGTRVAFRRGTTIGVLDVTGGVPVRSFPASDLKKEMSALADGTGILAATTEERTIVALDEVTGARRVVATGVSGSFGAFDVGEDLQTLVWDAPGGCTGCWAIYRGVLGGPFGGRLTEDLSLSTFFDPRIGPMGQLPLVRRMPAPVREDDGAVQVAFRLTRGVNREVRVRVRSASGSAEQGKDFAAVDQELVFPPFGGPQELTLQPTDDEDVEGDEDLVLTATTTDPEVRPLVDQDRLVLEDDDDDTAGELEVEDLRAAEPASGRHDVLVTVRRVGGARDRVTAGFRVEAGSATEGVDFEPVAAGTVDFADDQETATIPVTLLGDDVDELDETVRVVLTSGPVRDGEGVVTIADEDPLPAVSVVDGGGPEGEPYVDALGADVTAVLSHPSSRAVRVPLGVRSGTAEVGEDLPALADDAAITVPAGQLRVALRVPFTGDDAIEPDETATVVAGPAVAGLFTLDDAEARLTLRNDDHQLPPVLTDVPGRTTLLDHDDAPVAPAAQLTDPEDDALTEIDVTLSGNDPDEALTYPAPAGSPITGTYDAGARRLALRGRAPAAAWQAALRAVRFRTDAAAPARERTATVRAFDGADQVRRTTTLEVRRRPVARIAHETAGPLTIGLDGRASADPDGEVVAHRWDFGDGETSTDAHADHTYARPGRFTVRLTVTDDEGVEGTTTVEVRALRGVVAARSTPVRELVVDEQLACLTGVPARPSVVQGERCATLATVDGVTYGPAAGGLAEQAYTAVAQDARSGTGSHADPYEVRTVVRLGTTGVELEQRDRVVAGQGWWSSEVHVRNTGTAARAVTLVRALDCVLDADPAAGGALFDDATQVAGCRAGDGGQRLALLPLSAGAVSQAAASGAVLPRVRDGQLPAGTCDCQPEQDTAVATGWRVDVAPGATTARTVGVALPGAGGRLPLLLDAVPDFGTVDPDNDNAVTLRVRNPDDRAASLRGMGARPTARRWSYRAGTTTGVTRNDPGIVPEDGRLSWALPAGTAVAAHAAADLRFGVRHGEAEGDGGVQGFLEGGDGVEVLGRGDGAGLGVRASAFGAIAVQRGADVDTAITDGPEGLTRLARPAFTLVASRAGSSFECRVDAAAFAPCASPATVGPLRDGARRFEARAVGDATPAVRTFTVDTQAPATSIPEGPPAVTRTRDVSFGLRSDDPGARFECRLVVGDAPAPSYAACPSRVAFAALADGTYRLQARAVDAAGNVDARGAERTVRIDATAPQTTVERVDPGDAPVGAAAQLALRAAGERPRLSITGTQAALPLSCPAGAVGCTGEVELRTAAAVVAEQDFAVPPGATAQVPLPLTTPVRNLVERTGALPVTAVVTSGDARARETLTLQPDPRTARVPDAGRTLSADDDVEVRVACPKAHRRPCSGSLKVGLAADASAASRALGAVAAAVKAPGTAAFTVRPGRTARVRVPLTAGTRRAVTKGRTTVRLGVTTRRRGASALTKSLSLTLQKKGGRR